MKTKKRTVCLLAGSVLALAALTPMAASAHTHVFLGINLGGLFGPPPPVEVYSPPVYYAPPPPPVYYAPPAYYPPRVVYGEPETIYYYHRDHDWDRHGWHRGWRDHDDHGWHRGWRDHGDDDDDQ